MMRVGQGLWGHILLILYYKVLLLGLAEAQLQPAKATFTGFPTPKLSLIFNSLAKFSEKRGRKWKRSKKKKNSENFERSLSPQNLLDHGRRFIFFREGGGRGFQAKPIHQCQIISSSFEENFVLVLGNILRFQKIF